VLYHKSYLALETDAMKLSFFDVPADFEDLAFARAAKLASH
jgi:hypothetical protein